MEMIEQNLEIYIIALDKLHSMALFINCFTMLMWDLLSSYANKLEQIIIQFNAEHLLLNSQRFVVQLNVHLSNISSQGFVLYYFLALLLLVLFCDRNNIINAQDVEDCWMH